MDSLPAIMAFGWIFSIAGLYLYMRSRCAEQVERAKREIQGEMCLHTWILSCINSLEFNMAADPPEERPFWIAKIELVSYLADCIDFPLERTSTGDSKQPYLWIDKDGNCG